ncbi:MAG: O-antigen ligase family protein [Proteobacteria bacterium]|nr:O-antigen ligase family protein [Pseudomonadota bacterium]MBU4276676.1 O-antigen ligase family protein [Pseudomonadota bacterium]MBU4382277.1 O-antigen ligase family protein [Pseudomonadota bacterium]MBU4604230.1 O-antigen ligase family protein [Pseudomonadota bacterium]MCG2765943.1 O-antigen ligase family protein [Desulfarculaceae bacterium]
MSAARLSAVLWQEHPGLADTFYRLARLFALGLIFTLPLEAITAAREIAVVGMLFFLAMFFWARQEFSFRATVLFWPLIFYVATTVFSLFTAVDMAYTLKELRAEVLKGLLLFYAGVHLIQDEDNLRQFWGVILVGLAVMTVAGLIFFFHEGGSLLNHAVRAGSLHSGYGTLGTYLVLVWPYLLLAPLVWTRPGAKWLWLAFVLATALLAYTTYNRAAWLAMLLQGTLCLVMLTRHRLRTLLLVGLAALLAAGLMFTAPGSRHGERWDRLVSNPLKTGGTAGDLLTLWVYSYKQVKKDPFRGIGLGRHSFSKAFPEFRATHQPLLWHAHNTFVDLTLQLGVQGLAAILLIMGVLVWSLWPHSPPVGGEAVQAFGAATVAMVAGFCLRNLFDDFFVDDTGMMFWLLAGLALGGRELIRSRAGAR